MIIFGGVTDRLIPLFAIGAFLSFTLSQAGMVIHWYKMKGPHAKKSMAIYGLGATVTGITAIVVMIAKFTEGAWITLLMIPLLLFLMGSIRRHYHQVALEVTSPFTLEPASRDKPIVIVPIEEWNAVSRKALRSPNW